MLISNNCKIRILQLLEINMIIMSTWKNLFVRQSDCTYSYKNSLIHGARGFNKLNLLKHYKRGIQVRPYMLILYVIQILFIWFF